MNRRRVWLILTVLFLWVVVSRFTELEQFQATLRQGDWRWVAAALLMQAVYYTVFTASYQAAFQTVGIQTRTRDLLPVTLGALFVNVVAPAGGAGGTALFAEKLAQRGKSAAATAAGVLLQLVADFCAFALLLVPGLAYLFIEHDLQAYEVAAAVILLALTVFLAGVLLLALWRPAWLQRMFAWWQHTANWLFGRLGSSLSLAGDWAQRNSAEFQQAARAAAARPAGLLQTTGVAFAAHLVNLATLYLLFRAFNQPVGLGTLVAGYAVAILFWIVSITPQGIGVVEGVMALTLTSLGIPGAVATTVALTFRGLSFWLPFLLGFFAVQRMRAGSAPRRSLAGIWGVRVAALALAAMGMINLVSAVTPALPERIAVLGQDFPLIARHGGRLAAALAGFALLGLADGLWRRKRTAWALAMGVLAISAAGHLVKGLDYEEALLAGGLLLLLWLMRAHFHARSDRPSVRQGLRVLAGAAFFTLIYGAAGFYLLDHHYSVNFSLAPALRQTVIMFTQFYDPGLTPVTRFGRYFAGSIYIVGAATFGYAGLMLLRPVFLRAPATRQERARAQAIVEQYGRTSLARMVLFDDKRYYFSAGGSVLGYVLARRAAVVLGDPIGPLDDLPAAIQEFSAFCQNNDWLPVFYQALPESLESYRQAGLSVLAIGEEGVVNLEAFTLQGKEHKALRSPVNKLVHAGFTFKLYEPPIAEPVLAELRVISDEWLTMMHGTEKRFSVGWFNDDYLRNAYIGAVVTPEGWISAFANLEPEYQLNEISIDLMRRRKQTEPGTMEFLFVSLFEWAKGCGYRGFNLGLSGLYGVGEQAGDPVAEQVMHFIYEHVNQFYNFKGLHTFKEKFLPDWSPRYLIYPGPAHLVEAWLAVVEANSGGRMWFFGQNRKPRLWGAYPQGETSGERTKA